MTRDSPSASGPGGRSAASLLVLGASEIVTLRELGPGPVGRPLRALETVKDGALWAADGIIRGVGPTEDVLRELPSGADPLVIDAEGCTLVPGLVDPHTHLIYEGSRIDEHALRLAGASYAEIAERGGGIARTTAATRAAGFEQQLRHLMERLDRLLANGTTTVEVKTGYGLSADSELLQLAVLVAAERAHPATVIPTFLPAHAVPPEYADDPEGYVDLIVDEMLPRVEGRGLFFDVFCEEGYFAPAQTQRLLEAAREHGLRGKIHADELSDQGGAKLAAELGAVSADHLCYSSDDGLRALAAGGVVAVLLPTARFFLLADRYADARKMLELGIPVALGSDHSPTAATESMLFVIGLACAELRMTAAEALVAATRNAACSLGLGEEVGTLDVGWTADLLVLDVPSYEFVPCEITRPLVRCVIKGGRPVA